MPTPTIVVSRRLASTLETLRADFQGFVGAFGQLAQRKADLAPAFVRAYRQFHHETGRTFVAFVKELDPTLPAGDKDAYLRHRSYQAALYLKRLVDAPHTQAKHRKTRGPFDVLASAVRGLLPYLAPREEEYWASLARVSGWRERDVQRLRHRVAQARAIPLPMAPRLAREYSSRHLAAVAADRYQAAAG